MAEISITQQHSLSQDAARAAADGATRDGAVCDDLQAILLSTETRRLKEPLRTVGFEAAGAGRTVGSAGRDRPW